MTCASRLIECPHCAATGCRNEKCPNLVLATGKCVRCGQAVKKAKPLRQACRTVIETPRPAAPRTAAAIAAAYPVELPPPRPLPRPARAMAPSPSEAAHGTLVPPRVPPGTASGSEGSFLSRERKKAVVRNNAGHQTRSSALAGTGLLAVLLALGGYASQTAFTRTPRHPAPAGAVASIFVDAGVLTARYQHSTTHADDLFRGRMIVLSGRLERVGEDYVSVQARDTSVQCSFGRRTKAQERGLLPGAAVTLRGSVAGSPERGRIDVSGCELLASSE